MALGAPFAAPVPTLNDRTLLVLAMLVGGVGMILLRRGESTPVSL